MSGPAAPDHVPITDESIRLGQFLKLAGLADSGAHARQLLDSGDVCVNGEPEERRGRHLHRGDQVTLALPGGTLRAVVA